VSDEAGGKAEECFVDVVASFPADAQTSEAVKSGDRALDNPAMNPEARAMRYSAAADDRFDALSPDQSTVLVVVIAAVPEQDVRAATGTSHEPWDRRYLGQQGTLLEFRLLTTAKTAPSSASSLGLGTRVIGKNGCARRCVRSLPASGRRSRRPAGQSPWALCGDRPRPACPKSGGHPPAAADPDAAACNPVRASSRLRLIRPPGRSARPDSFVIAQVRDSPVLERFDITYARAVPRTADGIQEVQPHDQRVRIATPGACFVSWRSLENGWAL
jgi:hypothetical protein